VDVDWVLNYGNNEELRKEYANKKDEIKNAIKRHENILQKGINAQE